MTIPEETLKELERLATFVGGEQVLSLIAEIREQRKCMDAMAEALVDIHAVMNESIGVAGLHLNGDIVTWEELTDGAYSAWMGSIPKALAAYNKMKEQPNDR